jgi:predicted ATPase
MIEKMIIQNFKSIKYQTIIFKEFNVLIGANNSGKSNLLDCILLLQDIFRNPLESVFGPGPYSYNATFCRGGIIKTEPLGIQFRYKLNSDYFDYEIQISSKYNGRYNVPYVLKETLAKNDKEIKKTAEKKDSFVYAARAEKYDELFKSLIKDFKIRKYQFVPKTIKKEYSIGNYDYGFTPFLEPDGKNLLDVLYYIRENDASRYFNIIRDCQKFFPNLKNITIQRAGESTFALQVTMGVGTKEWRFIGPQLSDGFAIVLAIITLLNSKSLPNVILIEELENGLNPSSIERVLTKIFEISKINKAQFFVSTHSPVFIQLLRNNPEYIIVCELENGLSKYTPLDKKLTQFRNDYQKGESLLDIWLSGLIGGL